MYVVQEFLVYCEINHSKKSFYVNHIKIYDNNNLRKFFKKVIMTINYGLTKKGMKFKFKEQLVEMNKLLDWSDYNLNLFVNIFFEFLNNLALVKSLNILIDYVDFLIKNNKDFVVYTTFDGFIFNKSKSDLLIGLNYNKREKHKYSYSVSAKEKRKKKQMHLVFFNKERDKQKEIRAFKANYIHHIDSIIVYSLLNEIKNDKIDISVIHDCFGIKLNDIDIFNKKYRDVLTKLFNEKYNFLN
jgi:DNA-directed RNA polymerase